jgi:hypothetical protein
MTYDDTGASENPVGPGEPGGPHEPREHDIVKDINEEVGPEAIGNVAEEAFHLTQPIGNIVSGVLSMKSDQPDPEEEERMEANRRAEEEARAREEAARQEYEREHPGMHDEPDASVGDATTR